nr:DUF2066 domain-containing protein [Gammaproteobacteria bacterium]
MRKEIIMCCLRPAFLGLVAMLLWLIPGAVALASQEALYAARVPVASQDQGERQHAFRRAFEQVLTKVSGQRTLPSHPVITEALSRPEGYVAQFRYYSELEPATGSDESPSRALQLWAQFDAAAVDALLRDAHVAVWGQARPSVLLWFAVEEATGPVVLGADGSNRLTTVLEDTADRRGLPLILPLLDLEDRAQLSEGNLWGGFEEDILAASRRYQSEAVLVGRAYRLLSNQWEIRWKLYLTESSRDWSSRGDALEPLLEEGIHQAAGYIAERFLAANSSTAAAGMALVVGGIKSLRDYANLVGYLQALEAVKAVQVEKLQGDRVWFLLTVRGGTSALRDALALNRKLVPVAAAEALEFELRP